MAALGLQGLEHARQSRLQKGRSQPRMLYAKGSSYLSCAASGGEQVSVRRINDSDTGEPPQWMLHFAGRRLATRMNWDPGYVGGNRWVKLRGFVRLDTLIIFLRRPGSMVKSETSETSIPPHDLQSQSAPE